MSLAATAVFIKPSPIVIHYRSFNRFRCKSQNSCPSFCTMRKFATVCRKSVKFKKPIAAISTKTRFVNGSHDDKRIRPTISGFEQEALDHNGGVSYHQTQTAGYLHVLLNRLSKWVVAVTFGGFVMWRHDAFALWAATGSFSNFILSITLKRILKQERPLTEVSSGPGMPSSHAQTVFFTLIFIIMSVIKWMGLNGAMTLLGILLVALGSYFSWLRVLLGYHTTSQVIAGAIVGSNFAILWFWAWEAVLFHAYNSNPWVQILLFVGGACYYMGFIFYVFWHFVKD